MKITAFTRSRLGAAVFTVAGIFGLMQAPLVLAEEKSNAEKAKMLIESAKEQIVSDYQILVDEGMKELTDALVISTPAPFAQMVLSDNRVKGVHLDQANTYESGATVGVLQRSLYALAKNNKIRASAIFYVAADESDKTKRLVIVELEHLLGNSTLRAIPYKVENGRVVFSQPVDKDKEYHVFHYTNPNDTKKNSQ